MIADQRRRSPLTSDTPLRVLVIDDDANYLSYVAALSRRVGFTVATESDPRRALSTLRTGGYDAAVIDHEMPRMTGMDLISVVREDDLTEAIYAVMLTGHEDMETKLEALNRGFDDFVAKSSPEAEIVAKLAAARRLAARQRTMDVAIRELYGLATRDELTGLFNRRFFLAEVERLLSGGVPISLILFDLDDFKLVNDTHGHLAGDLVLRDIGALFHRSTRPEDIVARLGGDEFVMAVPDLPLREIERIAERLARQVGALEWAVDAATFTLGVSTGIASSRLLPHPTLAQLVSAADGDMYKNKWLRKHPESELRRHTIRATESSDRDRRPCPDPGR